VKRVLASLVVLGLLFLAGRQLVRMFASDATRIRWVLDDMVAGFDRTRMDPILAGLDRDFLDETYGADRDLVRAALVHLFFTAKDERTKKFLYRADWQETAAPTIEPGERDGDEKRARMELDVRFYRRFEDGEQPAWSVHVQAELARRDGDWRFVRTTTRTLSGERLRGL
jgi:hypothetical protein